LLQYQKELIEKLLYKSRGIAPEKTAELLEVVEKLQQKEVKNHEKSEYREDRRSLLHEG